MSESRHAPEPKPHPLPTPAPRLRLTETGCGHEMGPFLDETEDAEDFRPRFLAAFGTTEHSIAEMLFQDLLNVFHSDPSKPFDAATANLVLALLHRIGPKDELEAMLVCQMIVAHVASMDAARRALHVEQTASGRTALSEPSA